MRQIPHTNPLIQKMLGSCALALMVTVQAHAWTAVAFDQASGQSYTVANAASRSAAKAQALKDCRSGSRFAACELIGGSYRATATVVAKSTANPRNVVIGVASNPNPDRAAKIAMAGCSKTAKDCHLDTVVWDRGNLWSGMIVDAKTGFFHVFDNFPSDGALLRARDRACAKDDKGSSTCAFVNGGVSNLKSWYVIVRQGSQMGFGASSQSQAKATQLADQGIHVDASNQNAPRNVVDVYVNHGPATEPAGVKSIQEDILRDQAEVARRAHPEAATNRLEPDCRPSGGALTCTSTCVNGSCIVKYANGCKMHVRVQPSFDAFTSQWSYPSPGC